MRRQISNDAWEQIKTAFASGIGLREIARNMNIPEGTVLARASREQGTPSIQAAKSLAKAPENGIVPACDAAALTMQERAARYTERMADVSERVLPHLETLPAREILEAARNVEQFDRFSRRNFGLDSQLPAGGPIDFNLLANKSGIQIVATESIEPRIG